MIHRYVLLLRGINVGGSKSIKMADLKKTLNNIKFKPSSSNDDNNNNNSSSSYDDDILKLQNIKSYLASGNITFDLNTKLQSDDERRLEEEITNTLMEEYSFDVPVLLRYSTEFKQIIANNPFYSVKEKKIDDLYICLLQERPKKVELLEEMMKEENKDAYSPDEFEIVGHHNDDEDNELIPQLVAPCIYLKLKSGAAKTKLTNNMLEKKFKVNATTRNWKTMLELNKLLQ